MKRPGMALVGLAVILAVTSSLAIGCENISGRSPADVNDAPPAVSPGNADLTPGQLLGGDELDRVSPPDSKPVKKQLMKWTDAEKLLGDGHTPGVAGDRQVWLIQIYYPNGMETKAGIIPNALATEVIDAETGQSIVTKVERLTTTP